MIRFPITALSVIQSRRRQTAYDGLERLTLGQRAALGLDIGPAHQADDVLDRTILCPTDAQNQE